MPNDQLRNRVSDQERRLEHASRHYRHTNLTPNSIDGLMLHTLYGTNDNDHHYADSNTFFSRMWREPSSVKSLRFMQIKFCAIQSTLQLVNGDFGAHKAKQIY